MIDLTLHTSNARTVIDLNRLKNKFTAKYGTEPRIFRAPGRVNLIGEHTDYNDGFVLPCALDVATYVAASPRPDRAIRLASLNFDEDLQFDLDKPEQQAANNWTRYVQGVALVLEREGFKLRGADLLIDSDVPVGAGLSSSAALEISTAYALTALSGHMIDGVELARIGQTAEHEYAGVRTGIMDQFVSVFGRAGHALLLDCLSLEWSPVPLASGRFVICNTKVKHDLAEGEYNRRRAECEEAAAFFGKSSLRDVDIGEFQMRADEMAEILRKRARHVLTENLRVENAVTALKAEDLDRFGELMNESHESLRNDYEVSSPELDLMVELARAEAGVLGARMTGGGFGGCTINLVQLDDIRAFAERIAIAYQRETGIRPEIYPFRTGDGASEIESG
jgi:galactokinase